jgi:ATP-binding cassette subfamily B multidrug efflux pump
VIRFRGHVDDDREQERGTDWSALRDLYRFVAPYRRRFVVAFAILTVSFALEIALPFVVRAAIDGPLQDALAGEPIDRTTAWMLAGGFLAITTGSLVLGYAFVVTTTAAGQRIVRDVRVRLFGHVLRLPLDWLAKQSSGRLVTRVTTDVENLSDLITTGLLLTAFDLITIVGILGVLFFIDLRIALYAIAITPLFLLATSVFRRIARAAYEDVRTRLGRQNGFLGELIAGIRTTRAFGRDADVLSHWRELGRDTAAGWQRTVTAYATFFSFVDLTLRLATAGLLWFGSRSLLEGSMSAGVFVQAWLYFGKLAEPVGQLGEKYNVLQSALASAGRIRGLLARPEKPAEPPSPRPLAQPSGPSTLRIEHVSFAYRRDEPVLRDVSLEVAAGTTCALVGPTGAGKTTLLGLVSRLFDPDAGRILLDGVPIDELALEDLRGRIAVVPQDVFLFPGTIADNVRLFDPAISDERVREALATVGAEDLLRRAEGGIDRRVDERGGTLSLGERQLLSFARAVVRDPGLLVLDEATAHVDTRTEARLQAAVAAMTTRRSCLVVAHRLSTIERADHIAVLDQGRIVEDGTHAGLLRRDGLYARMVRHGHGEGIEPSP